MLRVYSKVLIAISLLCLVGYILSTTQQAHHIAGWILMAFFVFVALAFRQHEWLKGYAFTITIFAAVSLAMYYPQYFVYAGDFKLSRLIVPLMQILMFGMGTALNIQDFARVLKMPKGVVVGIVCQYSIMPFVGFGITKVFSFPPEIAAGVILIGSCPSGLASNVMSYLAKANLALSVTLTAIVTLMAPLMTPLFMKVLAGQYVTIDFWSMVWDITKIIILPIGAGLIFNYFVKGKFKTLDSIMPVISMLSIALIITIITAAGRNDLLVVGPLLILAALLHNMSGYFLGYWASRLFRMPEQDCRTVALEVGLQNGGLASSLALSMGKLATVGLASAVFAPIMNITGSSLALWWRSHEPKKNR
ncbi:MAG: bile acid:sodium symporter family protein [Chryseolinea sp.]